MIVLTPTQLKVLVGVLAGLSNQEIAGGMCVAEKTVKAHVTAILRKSGCRTRCRLLVAHYRDGLTFGVNDWVAPK